MPLFNALAGCFQELIGTLDSSLLFNRHRIWCIIRALISLFCFGTTFSRNPSSVNILFQRMLRNAALFLASARGKRIALEMWKSSLHQGNDKRNNILSITKVVQIEDSGNLTL